MVPAGRQAVAVVGEAGSAAASRLVGVARSALSSIFGSRGSSSVAGPAAEGAAGRAAAGEAAAGRAAAGEAAAGRAAAGEAAAGRAAAGEAAAGRTAATASSSALPFGRGPSLAPVSGGPYIGPAGPTGRAAVAAADSATHGVAQGVRTTGQGTRVGELPRGALPAQGPRAAPRPGARYTEDTIQSLTPKEIRALLEELGGRTYPPGTRAITMLPVLREALRAANRLHEVPVAVRNAQRAALNQTIPRIAPELATPANIQTPTPISSKVRTSAERLAAQNSGVAAADAERLFAQATEDSAALVEEVIPLSGRNLLTPIAEAEGLPAMGGRTARQAISELPPSSGDFVTGAEAEAILDSMFPGRVVARSLELGPQNLQRMERVYRGSMPARNVQQYNQEIRELAEVSLHHIPAQQARDFQRVFTLDRLTRLKAALGSYFLRNPYDARLILDELIAIIPRAQRNGAQYSAEVIDTLISNLNLQPARALAELVRTSSALAATVLEEGAARGLAQAKGMGWFGARAFYSLLAGGLGIVGLFLAAYANVTNVEELAREIRIGRDVFDSRFPGVAEFRDRAALFFQGLAATFMDMIYDTTGMERRAQVPPAAPGPPEVIRPSAEVWEWARYIGEYARMLRELKDVVIGARNRPVGR